LEKLFHGINENEDLEEEGSVDSAEEREKIVDDGRMKSDSVAALLSRLMIVNQDIAAFKTVSDVVETTVSILKILKNRIEDQIDKLSYDNDSDDDCDYPWL
jgi:hypothetical protein